MFILTFAKDTFYSVIKLYFKNELAAKVIKCRNSQMNHAQLNIQYQLIYNIQYRMINNK